MRTLLPAYVGFAFILMIIQTYLLVYMSLLLLRRMKLLKRPYSGMDHSESLTAAIIMLGLLSISSADVAGIFQAAKFYGDGPISMREPLFAFCAKAFLVILFFSLLFIFLNYINIRFLFRRDYQTPSLPVSIFLSVIAIGLALVCWFTCKEIVDNMTPRFVNFQ
jgi:hypothetical protein